jgi:hypothetical protein
MTAQARVVLAEPIDRPTYAISVFLLSFGQRGLSDALSLSSIAQLIGHLLDGPAAIDNDGLRQHGGRLVDGEGRDEAESLSLIHRGAEHPIHVHLVVAEHTTALGADVAFGIVAPLSTTLAHQMAPCVRGVRDLP